MFRSGHHEAGRALLRGHPRYERASEPERTHQVHAQDPIDVALRCLVDGASRANAGIGKDCINLSQLPERSVGERDDTGFVSLIDGHGDRIRPKVFRSGACTIDFDVGEHDTCALRQQGSCNSKANARCGTRDDGSFNHGDSFFCLATIV